MTSPSQETSATIGGAAPVAGAPSPSSAAALGPRDAEFWRQRWRDGQTGWDQGKAHADLAMLESVARARGHLTQGARILEPAAGRAHASAALARLGYDVTAFDVAPEAMAAAAAEHGVLPGLTLMVADALVVRPSWLGAFAAVYDRAALCALPPELRPTYIATLHAHLREGGALLTIPFTEIRAEPDGTTRAGPPFALAARDFATLLAPLFTLELVVEREVPGPDRIAKEAAMLWIKRAQPFEGSATS